MGNLQNSAAALTMVRNDKFFLKKWVSYYGNMFGRKACYIVCHGLDLELEEISEGCNIITIPYRPSAKFERKRWDFLNSIANGLRSYYNHIVVGDVDELIVIDPKAEKSLFEYLSALQTGRVLTPVGLEILHLVSEEKESILETILGPRRYVRHEPRFSKPIVVSANARISRGGHFSSFSRLEAPNDLYLFHLKFCDIDLFTKTMDHRNATMNELGVAFNKTRTGRHWFSEFRGEDAQRFSEFEKLEKRNFDDADFRTGMRETFDRRGDSPYYHFERTAEPGLFKIPERFVGLF